VFRDEPPGPGPHAALASTVRRRLLAVLRGGGEPQDAHQLAEAVGLHVSTVRFHLGVLGRAGLVTGHPQRRGTEGRPRSVYGATSRDLVADERAGYQALAELLAGHFDDTADRRAARAEQAGVAWADDLASSPREGGGMTAAQAARHVIGLFDRLGFEPELVAAGDVTEREPAAGDAAKGNTLEEGGWQVRLHACPFRTVARAHPEVVCNVHLGLLRGTLSRLGAPPTTVGLQPFVTPELCVASLTPAG
jgi:predicted ArsR family transcriptional regulator